MKIKIKDSRRLKLFCFIVFFAAVMFLQNKFLYSYDYPHTKTIVVSYGETLWDIASKYKSEREDMRKYIYRIVELNTLDSSAIKEGQELKVPILAKN